MVDNAQAKQAVEASLPRLRVLMDEAGLNSPMLTYHNVTLTRTRRNLMRNRPTITLSIHWKVEMFLIRTRSQWALS